MTAFVVEVKDELCHLTGVAVSNLFSWNSILLQLDTATHTTATSSSVNGGIDHHGSVDINHVTSSDDAAKGGSSTGHQKDEFKDGPLFVEYVHISSSSVKQGDRIKRGQVIGQSGT